MTTATSIDSMIEAKLISFRESAETQKPTVRERPIEVSQGMINQNLLTLTQHVKQGRIKTGEDLRIEAFPSGEVFRTDLMTTGNKLQERGAVGRFYQNASIHAEDFVILTEVSPGHWTLKKAPHGQYKSRRSRYLEL